MRLKIDMANAALVCAALLIAIAPEHPARAADVTVLTTETLGPVLRELAPDFESDTGNSVLIVIDSTGAGAARVERGEQIDLVILPAQAIDALAKLRKVEADSVVAVAKSGIGVVVKADAPLPDINSVDAFRSMMLAAPSFAYIDPETGGSGGVYLAKLFDRLGITQDIERKAVLVPGGLVASRVEDGEAAIGLQQISELRAVDGVTLVGPLPPAIQEYTVYAAGIPTAATNPAEGRAFLARLHGGAVARTLTIHGFDPP